MFIQSVIRALKAMRNERSLVHYLIRCRYFKDADMAMATSLQLESVIYNFTVPGSPLYPPRSVRNAAQQTQQYLYPRGSLVRAVIYVAFRLLHPYYTAQSILYWGREELRLLRQLGPLGYAEHVVQLRLKPLWHNFFKAKN